MQEERGRNAAIAQALKQERREVEEQQAEVLHHVAHTDRVITQPLVLNLLVDAGGEGPQCGHCRSPEAGEA